MEKKPKIIVILGPTSSGKSDLAVKIASKFNGEIISADSRQVYRGMNIGTGKITKKEMRGIPHYLLDVISPQKRFDAARYKILAQKAIDKIIKKDKIPIICGGTGFYIDTIIGNINLSNVPPNWKLRKELEKKSVEKLFTKLKKLNPERAAKIDSKNKRRIIRAIEIYLTNKKESDFRFRENNNTNSKYNFLKIGIKIPKEILKKRIYERLIKRLKSGMVAEVKKLENSGVSWKRLDEFGLEYRYVSRYLKGILNKDEMIKKLNSEIWKYSKRQITWFKRDKDIYWIKNIGAAEKLVEKFIKK